MKWVIAIVQPHRLDDVREALLDVGMEGLTVCEVKGYGRQKGHTEVYRGAEYQIQYVPKMKIELAVDDANLDTAITAISNGARTGRIGDGKIFVVDLGSAVRIRTGETGADAI
ncbi:MAG: P-II family nitrogen regulator [Pseudomonadota bacterium]